MKRKKKKIPERHVEWKIRKVHVTHETPSNFVGGFIALTVQQKKKNYQNKEKERNLFAVF
jgi:hypothetical protein